MTVPQRLSFSAQLTNCNLATCWHIELSIRGHLSIIIHLSNSFSCSMKFFHLKIALGLALGESWPLLAQPQKNTDVHKGIDPNMSNSGHHDCSTKAVFLRTADKLQCWPMLARNGTYWRMLAFSFLHISFIGTNSFSGSIWFYQIKFFHLKMALGLALGESWPLLAQPQKNTDVYRQTCINHLRDVNCCKLMGTNTMALIQAIMTVSQRLSFSAQLTNCNVGPCWHIMGHIGACWHSAFSTFHSLGQ